MWIDPPATTSAPDATDPTTVTSPSGKKSDCPDRTGWVTNIEGKAFFGHDRRDALAAFEAARARGAKLIDLGCMQINHHYHAEHFRSVEAMLDPRQNVDYAARFLVRLHARHETWSMAVARYHAGPDNDPAQKRYVCRVIANMVATGFGKWTANARAFCNP